MIEFGRSSRPLRFLTLLVFVRRDAWAAAMGDEPVASAYGSLVGLLEAPGTAFRVSSLGCASGVFGGLTKARLVRIFVGLGGYLAGLMAWLGWSFWLT